VSEADVDNGKTGVEETVEMELEAMVDELWSVLQVVVSVEA